jgi:hypothetical protein
MNKTFKEKMHRFIWRLGYKPLKEKKDESIITTIKKSIRTRKGRELEAEIENIMFETKLINSSGEYAMHLNTSKKSDNHYITMWKIPRGLSYKKYMEKQRIFEDNLGAQVIIEENNGALKIEIIKGIIPRKVSYDFNYDDYRDIVDKKGNKKYVLPIPVGVGHGNIIVWDLIKIIP